MFRYLYWGGDTAHNTTYYSELRGDTAHNIGVRCSYWGGDTAQNSKTEAGTPHKRIEQMKYTGGGTPHIEN